MGVGFEMLPFFLGSSRGLYTHTCINFNLICYWHLVALGISQAMIRIYWFMSILYERGAHQVGTSTDKVKLKEKIYFSNNDKKNVVSYYECSQWCQTKFFCLTKYFNIMFQKLIFGILIEAEYCVFVEKMAPTWKFKRRLKISKEACTK